LIKINTWIKFLYEIVLNYTRYIRRKQIFQVALNKSKTLDKPLLVIGDPDNGTTNHLLGRCYGCGDVCLDITGCIGCPNGVKATIEEYLPTLKTNSHVIFISCVLEYVKTENIDFIIQEIKRVSGDDYFIVSVDPYSLTALFYPTKILTGESGPNQIILSEYPSKDFKYFIL
jgi:hypothetical protein